MNIEQSRIAYALRSCERLGYPVYEPRELIKVAIEKHGDELAVACSFGACSVVVLHMALAINPNIKIIFNDTGVEYPETYAYRNLLIKEWKLNLIETKGLTTFWSCVHKYGWPTVRTKRGFKEQGRTTWKPQCCILLKEKPTAQACKDFHIRATLTGIRCAESRARMFVVGRRGQYYHTEKMVTCGNTIL